MVVVRAARRQSRRERGGAGQAPLGAGSEDVPARRGNHRIGSTVLGMTSQTKPTVTIPNEQPPSELTIEEIEEGTGAEAQSGSEVQVHYVGVSWSSGDEFDSSWNRNEHFEFPLGAGHVIAGWDQGVAGMRVGGRRRLTIPPHLGYGAQGAGGVIGPNETLVFVVDLVGVR